MFCDKFEEHFIVLIELLTAEVIFSLLIVFFFCHLTLAYIKTRAGGVALHSMGFQSSTCINVTQPGLGRKDNRVWMARVLLSIVFLI